MLPATHFSRLRSSQGPPALSVVVPLFNEEENIPALWDRLCAVLESTPLDYEMDRRAIDALNRMPEQCRFVRGLRGFVGFRQVALPYDRPARAAGRPKYTIRKLTGLAVDGLVSFSSYPLRLVTYLGVATTGLAIVLAAWVLNDAIGRQSAPRGWASTLVVVLFMGAIQLLSLGIIGEYVRLIFLEAKKRPTYIVEELKRHPTAARENADDRDSLPGRSLGHHPTYVSPEDR